MTQYEGEILEENVERFYYNLQQSRQAKLAMEIDRVVVMKNQNDCIKLLNFMSEGDISQQHFENIMELCLQYFRGTFKFGT